MQFKHKKKALQEEDKSTKTLSEEDIKSEEDIILLARPFLPAALAAASAKFAAAHAKLAAANAVCAACRARVAAARAVAKKAALASAYEDALSAYEDAVARAEHAAALAVDAQIYYCNQVTRWLLDSTPVRSLFLIGPVIIEFFRVEIGKFNIP